VLKVVWHLVTATDARSPRPRPQIECSALCIRWMSFAACIDVALGAREGGMMASNLMSHVEKAAHAGHHREYAGFGRRRCQCA
jgi:hypothetical protein